MNRSFACLVVFAGCLVFSTRVALAAPIQVDGIQDRQNLTGSATFQVVTEPGYQYEARLDSQPVPLDVWHLVERGGYHQIDVSRTPDADGDPESSRIQFNLYDPIRGSAEWGLYPWTPLPGVYSASNEFSGASLVAIAPNHFPAQRSIPWIGLIEDGTGHGKRLNGLLTISGASTNSIALKRGISQSLLPRQDTGVSLSIDASVHGLAARHTCTIDGTTTWQTYSGDLSGDTIWPANGRVHVTGDLRIPNGTTLTVGAGCIVVLDTEVDIVVDGSFMLNGTREDPAVFMPAVDEAAWGGFMLYQPSSRATVTGAIFMGSGAVSNWMSSNGYDAHRTEQALFLLDAQSEATLQDVYVIESAGQAFHGQDATLSLDHVLVRECTTVGQFNNSTITMRDCALIDFPYDDDTFVDADNDALYFNQGRLEVTHTLLGWTKDDGIDSGGGGGGTVLVSNCWFEACFHEGMALSGTGKQITVIDSVFVQCGQGIETGYGSPQAFVNHCLFVNNQVGLRFGDNYDWSYGGFLRATNCISIHNDRDVWNMCRDIWAPRPMLVDIQNNWQLGADPAYPNNRIWNPDSDATRLDPFIAMASTPGPVGIGFSRSESAAVEQATTVELVVALSMISSQTVIVDYATSGTATPGEDFRGGEGRLAFPPGSLEQAIRFDLLEDDQDEPTETLQFRLVSASQGAVSALQSTHTFSIVGGIQYVSPTGTHQPPFDSWIRAATNLQDAIDNATSGSTVLVTNGHYILDAPLLLSQGVTVRSVNGPGQTVIDGDQAHRCLTVTNPDAIIDGFAITRGSAFSGAGVYLDGGGTVQNCLIVSNEVTGSGADGGGITCYRGGTVARCIIRRNTAADDAGGVYCYQGGRVTDCVVTENLCGDKGGGIYARNGGQVEHCTVTSNTASYGGGLYNVGGSARNSIFYFNSADNGFNVFNSENQTSYSGCCSDPAQAGANNLANNPGFLDGPVRDLRLQSGSPCIDAGTAPGSSTIDNNGLPRPLDGDRNGAAVADIGAYEYLDGDADSDADGLPDGWERDHELDPTNRDGAHGATGDPDQDNMINQQEYAADTHPGDPNSLLAIRELVRTDDGFRILLTGGIAAIQVLETHANLASASAWTPVATNYPPTPLMSTVPVSDPDTPLQGYRIRATRP